jgi:nitronate monooxygenase
VSGSAALSARARAKEFCARYGLQIPILLAPMAGASPVALSVAVANEGGMGAMGALLTVPEGIVAWADAFRQDSSGSFQLNLWVPDPPPARDAAAEEKLRRFLATWGPEVRRKRGMRRPRISRRSARPFSQQNPARFPRSWGSFRQTMSKASRQRVWLVCHCHDAFRSAPRRGGGGRRDCRSGFRGWWPSWRLRPCRGRKADSLP